MDAAAAHAICDSRDPVAALAGNAVLWGELAGDAMLMAALRLAVARVQLAIGAWLERSQPF